MFYAKDITPHQQPRPSCAYLVLKGSKDKKHKKPLLLLVSVSVLVCLMVSSIFFAPFAYAKTGHWERTSEITPTTPTETWAFKDDRTGEQVGQTLTLDRQMEMGIYKSYSYKEIYAKGMTPSGYVDSYIHPDVTYDTDTSGVVHDSTSSTKEIQNPSTPWNQDATETAGDFSNKLISEGDVPFSLSTEWVQASATRWLWGITRSFVDWMCGISRAVLSVIDATATPILTTENFTGGTFGTFYSVASTVASRVAVPFATAFLGVTMGIAMVRATEQRRRNHVFNGGHTLLSMVFTFVLCYTLIVHALDICAFIYWVGVQLVRWITSILATTGVGGSAGAAIGESMTSTFLGAMDKLTYSSGGAMIVIALLCVLATVVSFGCMFYVVTVAFMRMVEIYLRASFAPLAMSFFMSDATKQMGWAYLKRFGSLCFQAGIILLALAFSGLLFTVANTLFANVFTGAQDLGSILSAVVPALIAVTSMTAVVKKSESVSNAIFGLN